MPSRPKKKIRVAVLMGGPSAEHEVSLNTGKMVAKFLDWKKYAVKSIKISRQGKWPIGFSQLRKDFDLAFLALHGEYGEDGTIQKILDKIGLRYTGSGARASALGMDKQKSAVLFVKAGLKLPHFTMVKQGKEGRKGPLRNSLRNSFGFPVVVKPNDRGSSVGVHIVKKAGDFSTALKDAFRYSSRVLVQQFISGRELTCGVIEIGNRLKPLLPIEIMAKGSDFYDYRAKYATGGSVHVIPPADFSSAMVKKVQRIALKVHQVIGAAGYSRADMILTPDGKLYVLEINTLPGMTATSLLPDSARVMGIKFSQLLDLIIASALKKR